MQNFDMLENRNHSTPYIPYSFYNCCMPDFYANVPMHWHDEFEINCIMEGRGEFICGDMHFQAEKGDILILPPNTLHSAAPLGNTSLIYQAFVFHPVMLGMNMKDRCTMEYIRPLLTGHFFLRNFYHRNLPNYIAVKACVEQLFSFSPFSAGEPLSYKNSESRHTDSPLSDLMIKGVLLQLFGHLLSDAANITTENSVSYSEIIRPALEYMMKNYRESITIEDLAATCHISSSYFMTCFKKATGVGAMEYLSLHRINVACRLLIETKDNVANIAYACGYNNLSNFNRQFRKRTGYSPKEYRR